MGELFFVYLQNSLQLCVIALLMLAVSPLLARRYSAKCRYYLWAVIFVALIFPIRAKITLELPILHSILPQSIEAAAPDAAAIANTVSTWDWHNYAGILWVAGAFCFLSWHFFQHLRFLSAVRRWNENIEDVAVLELFAKVKAELIIREHITVKSCACIKTPMVIGLFRPTVLLPQVDFSRDELPLILKHELVHYKRKDLWYKALMMLTVSIHWFNPVVHLMVKSVLNLCEISCDEEVLKKIDAKGRARYGEAIIGAVRNGNSYKTAISTNFYSGTKGMKKRIYAMMDMTSKRFSPALFMVVVIVTVCGATTFALSPAGAEGIVQDSKKTITTATDPDQTNAKAPSIQPSVTPNMEQNNQVKPSSNNSGLLFNDSEPRLIPIDEYIPTEPSQEQAYDPDMPRLIIDNEQP